MSFSAIGGNAGYAELVGHIQTLRDETNFDITAAINDTRKSIRDVFGENCQGAAQLLYALHELIFKGKDPKLEPPPIISRGNKYNFPSQDVVRILQPFRDGRTFASFVNDALIHNDIPICELAFSIFPSHFFHFLDASINAAAVTFLTELLSLNRDNLPLVSPFLRSFFMGCYEFHDFLWHTFLYHSSTNPDLIPTFIWSLKPATGLLSSVFPLFEVIDSLSHEFLLDFLVHDFLLPSLTNFHYLFSGTNLVAELTAAIESNAISIWAILHSEVAGPSVPTVSGVFFESGLPCCFRASSLLHLVTALHRRGRIPDLSWRCFAPRLGTLEGLRDRPVVFGHILVAAFPPRSPLPPSNAEFGARWEKMRLLPDSLQVLLDSPGDFALFALHREVEILEVEKLKLAQFLELNLILRDLRGLESVLESVISQTVHCVVPHFFALGIPAKASPPKLLAARKSALAAIETGKFDHAFRIAAVDAILDRIDRFAPSTAQFMQFFVKEMPTRPNSSNSNLGDELVPVEEEIRYYASIIARIPNCKCGKQLQLFGELAGLIVTAVKVLGEAGLEVRPEKVLASIWPWGSEIEILKAAIRVSQICMKEVAVASTEKVELLMSWISSLYENNEDIVAKLGMEFVADFK
jgi:hypothetical protein